MAKDNNVLVLVDEIEDLKPIMPKKIVDRFENLASDWKQKIYDLALEGESDIGLYTALALTRRTHESLLKIEDYNEWFSYCHDVSINWWYNFGKAVAKRKDYNGATYNLIMQNRAGWGQQQAKAPELPTEPTSNEPTKTIEDFKPVSTQEPANH